MRHLQPPRRRVGSRAQPRRRRLPRVDRPRDCAWRQLLPYVPPLGDSGAGRGVLPAIRRVPPAQAAARPARAAAEQLVPALPRAVLIRARRARDGVGMSARVAAIVFLASTARVPLLTRCLASLTSEPHVGYLEVGGIAAVVARPRTRASRGTILFLNGGTALGCGHPAVRRVACGVARA